MEQLYSQTSGPIVDTQQTTARGIHTVRMSSPVFGRVTPKSIEALRCAGSVFHGSFGFLLARIHKSQYWLFVFVTPPGLENIAMLSSDEDADLVDWTSNDDLEVWAPQTNQNDSFCI